MTDYWGKKTFCLVTGASRGIGREIAVRISKLISSGSVIMLVSRDAENMLLMKQEINVKRPDVRVQVCTLDLSVCDELEIETALSGAVCEESFTRAFCFHNAGSLGDASKKCTDWIKAEECSQYLRLNLVSVIVLNSLFVRMFKNTQKIVINISSLCALVPFTSLSLYCTGKAARDMFFKVLILLLWKLTCDDYYCFSGVGFRTSRNSSTQLCSRTCPDCDEKPDL